VARTTARDDGNLWCCRIGTKVNDFILFVKRCIRIRERNGVQRRENQVCGIIDEVFGFISNVSEEFN